MKTRGAMRLMPALLALACAAAPGGTGAAVFEPYEIILQRKPFGEPPALPPTGAPQLPAPPAFLSAVRLTAIVRDDNGRMRVGFVHGPTQRAYWVELGKQEEGIEVVEADFRGGRARLRRGEEDFWLSLNGETVPADRAPSTLPEVIRSGVGGDDKTLSSEAEAATPDKVLSPGAASARAAMLSYAQRRQLREEARRQKREAALRGAGTSAVPVAATAKPNEPKGDMTVEPDEGIDPTREQMEQALMEYQMNRIRQGLPPLPVPLTPEMDEQLIREGVLPPVE